MADNKTFTFTVTPTAQGAVSVSVAATSSAGGAYTIELPQGTYKLFIQPNTAGYPDQWHDYTFDVRRDDLFEVHAPLRREDRRVAHLRVHDPVRGEVPERDDANPELVDMTRRVDGVRFTDTPATSASTERWQRLAPPTSTRPARTFAACRLATSRSRRSRRSRAQDAGLLGE